MRHLLASLYLTILIILSHTLLSGSEDNKFYKEKNRALIN